MKILTPEDLASLLQISKSAVYQNKIRFGGFYPAGLKVLRFREDVINDIIQNGERVAVRLSERREEIYRQRIQDKKRSLGGRIGKKKSSGKTSTDPARHGL